MTDQEINETVARKLGWTIHEKISSADNGLWHRPGYSGAGSYLPDYCHSIEAAWEVVEKHPFIPDDRSKASFQLMRREENQMVPEVKIWEAGWARYDDCMILSAYADTAPMAICLAFLKLKEAE